MNVFSRGVRNTFRNGVRTISIVLILGLSIGLALSMLLARQAVDTKIESVKSSIGNTVTVSPAGVRGFEGGGEPLTEDQITKIKAISNVTAVSGTLTDRLTADNSDLESAIDAGSLGQRFNANSNGSGTMVMPTPPAGSGDSGETRTFTPPVTVTGATDTTTLSSVGTVTLSSGAQIDGNGSANEALVGAALAEKNGLTVESTFKAYSTDIVVKGIIDDADNRFAGNQVVLPLKTLQTLSEQTGDLTSATVQVSSIDQVDAVTSAIEASLGDAVDVVNQQETAATAVAPLESIRSISIFALIAAVGAGAVIILLTMIMIVRERRREIGVLKAIGASNRNVTIQFMVEAITFTLLAAVVGIGIGILAANPITDTLVNNAQSSSTTTQNMGGMMGAPGGFVSTSLRNVSDVNAVIDWHLVLYGLGASLIIAIVGSVVSTWFITKIRPAEAIRAE